jgi:hypothetical protein
MKGAADREPEGWRIKTANGDPDQVWGQPDSPQHVRPAVWVDAMKAAGPAPCDDTPQMRALNYVVSELTKRPKLTGEKITKPGFSLDLNGGR